MKPPPCYHSRRVLAAPYVCATGLPPIAASRPSRLSWPALGANIRVRAWPKDGDSYG